MSKKLISGNEAIAYGALSAGVKVVSGYPGTPSTETTAMLLTMDLPGTKVEWSTNEKVAFEVAAGSALMGQRSMCTMKMSGVNVAYDSIIGIAYSGCTGGLVIFVADDPGVSAGMPEEDTRGFAIISDMPVLEPSNLQEAYEFTKYAFELSEAIQGPVFLRSVTALSQSHGIVDIGERVIPPETKPLFARDITKYTKAGADICMRQHNDLIGRLAKAGEMIGAEGLNRLILKKKGGVGMISVGVVNSYVEEALNLLNENGVDISGISLLFVGATLPYPDRKIEQMLENCARVLVAEELEPHLENRAYLLGYQMKADTKILGKNDGTYKRSGNYTALHVVEGLCGLLDIPVPEKLSRKAISPAKLAAARPITVCAGCPHRGVYIAINQAVKNLGYKKDDVMVTGDIGCTILGISAPFETLWTEVAMGASIPLAQGFVYGGTKTPVIATIGDSTFFHAGIPGLVNALQHNVNLTVVIMDNYWTAMTGMQINPGTVQSAQKDGWHSLDLEKVVAGLGVEDFHVVDSYAVADVTKAIQSAMEHPGVSVVLARRECAIQAARRKVKYHKVHIVPDKCTLCRQCIHITGCPALSLGDKAVKIDYSQCNGCGICAEICKFHAIEVEEK
ncbi:MAG: thiamine pyrophosphate-dependent enzyme [Oscillospiraceae bacterium]